MPANDRNVDLDALEQKARAATPDQDTCTHCGASAEAARRGGGIGGPLRCTNCGVEWGAEAREAFIAAANPAAIIALVARLRAAEGALAPLIAIANAYDDNGLDETRPDWVERGVEKQQDPDRVELYCGRGGRRLLTLGDAFRARAVLARRGAP